MWVTNGIKEEAYEKLVELANKLEDYLPNGTIELQFDPAKYRVVNSDGYVTLHFLGIQSFGNDIKNIVVEMINLSENFIIKPISDDETDLIFGIFHIHEWDNKRKLELTEKEKEEFGLTDEEMDTPIEKF